MLHLPVSTCRRNKKRTFGDRSRLKKREIVATHTLGKLLLYGFKVGIQKNKYRTCTIITRGLYNFYPIFHCGLYCRRVSVTENLCTTKGNSSTKKIIMEKQRNLQVTKFELYNSLDPGSDIIVLSSTALTHSTWIFQIAQQSTRNNFSLSSWESSANNQHGQ